MTSDGSRADQTARGRHRGLLRGSGGRSPRGWWRRGATVGAVGPSRGRARRARARSSARPRSRSNAMCPTWAPSTPRPASRSRARAVNGLVNAPGSPTRCRSRSSTPRPGERTIGINLSGSFFPCVRSPSASAKREREGRSSTSAPSSRRWGARNYSAYCASKFAVVGLTKALAASSRPGIRVNVLCPGPSTRRCSRASWRSRADPAAGPRGREPAAADRPHRRNPARWPTRPVWLLAEARFATGAVVPIDGGTTTV